MKTNRQSKIIEIIQKNEVETQDELSALLEKDGFRVTQATVSRDIRELKLTKIPTAGGRQKYAVITDAPENLSKKYERVLREGFLSMDMAQNILVIKTVSGMASAVCAAIDAMKMRENNYHMQKMTINFPKDVDDNYYCRDEVFEHLKKIPEITLVSGGYGNLEFTKAGVDKGVALHKLAQILNIAADETMAVGDTENDMAIVKAAHIGVAMGNATDELKAQADYVTDTNENDGVAKAIRHFMG